MATGIIQPKTVICPVVAVQPVVASVKVKVAVPPPMPVTIPSLVTVATSVLLLAQVPPDVGLKVVVSPAKMLLALIFTSGSGLIVTSKGSESISHPVTSSITRK